MRVNKRIIIEAMRCHIFVWGQVRGNNFCRNVRREEVVFDSRRSENWCDYFADAEPADEDFLIDRSDVITDRADFFDDEPEDN